MSRLAFMERSDLLRHYLNTEDVLQHPDRMYLAPDGGTIRFAVDQEEGILRWATVRPIGRLTVQSEVGILMSTDPFSDIGRMVQRMGYHRRLIPSEETEGDQRIPHNPRQVRPDPPRPDQYSHLLEIIENRLSTLTCV